MFRIENLPNATLSIDFDKQSNSAYKQRLTEETLIKYINFKKRIY